MLEGFFTALATLIGALIALIPYIFGSFGIFWAGWGFYKKVKNDTRMALYNKAFDAYRDYSNIIFHYINLISEDDHFDINNPQYKEAHQKLRYASGEAILLADANLRLQINRFIDYSLAFSQDQETSKNMDEVKTELLAHLFDLQRTIKNHLDDVKPLIK